MDSETEVLTGYRKGDIIGEVAKSLADTIRVAFRRSGMSIKKLSEETGVPYAACHSFLTGEGGSTLTTADKFCRALGLELVSKRRKKRG